MLQNSNRRLFRDTGLNFSEAVSKNMPSPKSMVQGQGVYVTSKQKFYKKVGYSLVPVTSDDGGTTITNIQNISSDNASSKSIASILELSKVNSYITVAQGYGEIVEPIRTIVDFKKISRIYYSIFVCSSDHDVEGYKQRMSNSFISIGGSLPLTKKDTLEFGFTVNTDKYIQMVVRERNSGLELKGEQTYRCQEVMTDTLYSEYSTNVNVALMLEISLNVKY